MQRHEHEELRLARRVAEHLEGLATHQVGLIAAASRSRAGLWRATPCATARSPAEHAESCARLPAQVPAVVVLGDQFEIEARIGAVAVLDLQADIRETRSGRAREETPYSCATADAPLRQTSPRRVPSWSARNALAFSSSSRITRRMRAPSGRALSRPAAPSGTGWRRARPPRA